MNRADPEGTDESRVASKEGPSPDALADGNDHGVAVRRERHWSETRIRELMATELIARTQIPERYRTIIACRDERRAIGAKGQPDAPSMRRPAKQLITLR